jgi:acetyl esterase/lipase
MVLFRLLATIAALLGCCSSTLSAADGIQPLVLAHYMPWYASKEVSGAWGWHWTMKHFDPDQVFWNGKREVASHDQPLIGPYDSGDDHALECQVLLMRFSGLHGVIIDWYGTGSHFDHAANHQNVLKLIPWLKKAGLRYAVCYEDKALAKIQPPAASDSDPVLNQAQNDLLWAEKNWFGDSSYIRQDGRPILLLFGPQALKQEQWRSIRSKLSTPPLTFALPHLAGTIGAEGSFAWPPVTGGKTLSAAQWAGELTPLYNRAQSGELVIATAFPGFKDIYKQAGVSDSLGSIPSRAGATFTESLELAFKSGAPVIQIATWNDYGEGTVVEPTCGAGYKYLEILQTRMSVRNHRPADLRLPVMLYQLRKRSAGDDDLRQKLDRASKLLFESKSIEAEAELAKVAVELGKRPAVFADFPNNPHDKYRLVTEVPYRTGDNLTQKMHQRCRLDLYHPVDRQPYSTVVWFHGGGLTAGEREIPMQLRKRGIAVVAVNYRLSPGAKAPEYIEDAAAAVAWTLNNIHHYGGAQDRVFVGGHSAGAYLALMLGLDKRWLGAHGLEPKRIAGLIPLSPQVITHFAIREERGISEKQPVVDDLAPLFHVNAAAPPMLVVTGDREKELMGRYEENAYFCRMMKLSGHQRVIFHELQGFDHGKMVEPAMPLLLRFVTSMNPFKNAP